MSRPIVLSNGEMHVGINAYGMVHDVYYPYVGQENHTAGKQLRHKIGVWVDGQFSWCDDGNWRLSFSYHYSVLVGHTIARHDGLGIILEFDDFVDSTSAAFIRNIHIINHGPAREIRLYMHQVFVISDSYGSDTAQYLPDESAIVHYKGHRAFVVSLAHADGTPFDNHSVGLFGIEGHEGTYRDAEDGILSGNNNEHGRVDSVMQLTVQVRENSSERASYWLVTGKTQQEALVIHRRLQHDGIAKHLLFTTIFWQHWTRRIGETARRLEGKYRKAFVSSALVVRSHIDKRGAVIASTDTAMLKYWRDGYMYFWPRDGAYGIWPLIRLGYTDEALQFFSFCRRVMDKQGYMMHKYQADGAIGASWHSYVHNGKSELPIQEDETAIVLFIFSQYYSRHQDIQLLKDYYPTLLLPMAQFLAGYIDETTGLPHDSYDLWEQKYLSTTYTTAVVYAALVEAADLADIMKDTEHAVHWRALAENIKRAAHKYLFNKDKGFFYKGIQCGGDELVYDDTIDTSSFFGAFMFGLFDTDSAEMKRAYQSMLQILGRPDSPALPRYENDDYLRVDPSSLGNNWFITTLWHAQYLIEIGEADRARNIIDWVVTHATDSGMLSEQIHSDGTQVSVSPLAWSHAELLSTLSDLADKYPHNESMT